MKQPIGLTTQPTVSFKDGRGCRNTMGRTKGGDLRRILTAITVLGLMLVPTLAAAVPMPQQVEEMEYVEEGGEWWLDSNMDINHDQIHDAIWIAAESTNYD